jgi:hypothetical protein
MKKPLVLLGALLLLVGSVESVTRADESVTLDGVGLCAKCGLGEADSCQNAIKIKEGGKEVVYLLTANDVSKAFHKNLCSGTKNISAVGAFTEIGGKKFFTANKLSVSTEDVVKGEGLCLKCALGLTPSCQNAIRVGEAGKQVLYIIEHNDVSKKFHGNLCSSTAAITATGKVADVDGLPGVKKFTASKLALTKVAAKVEAAPQAVAKVVTIKGEGLCAKCALGKTSVCQNAVKVSKGGKEIVYLFAANDVSKAFHKNLCSGSANIVATGTLEANDEGGVFTATNLALQEAKKLEGTALCLKCELGKSRTCQNAIRVSIDGKDVVYALDQNSVSKKFHRHVCQETVAVVAEGTIAAIGDNLEFTASKIEVK